MWSICCSHDHLCFCKICAQNFERHSSFRIHRCSVGVPSSSVEKRTRKGAQALTHLPLLLPQLHPLRAFLVGRRECSLLGLIALGRRPRKAAGVLSYRGAGLTSRSYSTYTLDRLLYLSEHRLGGKYGRRRQHEIHVQVSQRRGFLTPNSPRPSRRLFGRRCLPA